ncbi:hypothetical protein [Mesorhizobium shangrilense]|uniref:Uncharacterized protein n=1 Tax=Mesorhizobium shangrilense TaxID=460060 RepID=A0ABV2D7N9_9HYPH
MARWTGLGVAAVAALSFVAVKALSWALGFAGGKYLYETATGTVSAPPALTTAQIRDQIQGQGFQIFKAIEQEFPAEYEAIVQKIAAVTKAGGGIGEVCGATRAAVTDHKGPGRPEYIGPRSRALYGQDRRDLVPRVRSSEEKRLTGDFRQ